MNFYSDHYRTGQEIRAGDEIVYDGKPGRVLFVLSSSEFPADWEPKDWFVKEFSEGFMLDTEVMGFVFEQESDEDLDFVRRKS